MYASRITQFWVGIFALVGIAALAYLSFRLGRVELFSSGGYMLYANYDNVSGLKENDRVEIAGVPVGRVVDIGLNNERARVGMLIDAGVKVDDEAIASIKTSGIIGDKYVSISSGAGERTLSNGDTIRQTESAFVLEDAIGQLINSSGPSGGAGKERGAGKDQKDKKK